MNSYIRSRLRADAGHLVARATAEHLIVHRGLRGRFRELLVDSILSPWLPPYAVCATGMIVDNEDRVRESTQEDIVVFDRSLVPGVLAHSSAAEGVFPVDGVLARVEVKSTLTRGELRKAVLAAKAIYEMNFYWDGRGKPPTFPRSAVFAFSSDLETTGGPVKEIERLLSVVDECGLYFKSPCDRMPGPISALCVVGRGFWGYGKRKGEQDSRWIQATGTEPHNEILNFVGWMSNSCFDVHADHMSSAGGGIGNFILSSDICEDSPVQEPPKASV